jgi:hypothetical protein
LLKARDTRWQGIDHRVTRVWAQLHPAPDFGQSAAAAEAIARLPVNGANLDTRGLYRLDGHVYSWLAVSDFRQVLHNWRNKSLPDSIRNLWYR